METMPSCIAPPAASVGSSQWSATGMPKVRAYSSAVRIRWLETTGLPSSLTATAPAPTSSPNSASCCPFCPSEIAPIGIDPRLPRPLRLAHDEADRRLVVGDRIGVGHGAHRGEAAGRGGHGARSRPSPGPPGPARAGARAGRSGPGATTLPARVDARSAPSGRPRFRPTRLDLAVLQVDVGHAVGAARRIDDPAAADQNRPSSLVPPRRRCAQSGAPPASR